MADDKKSKYDRRRYKNNEPKQPVDHHGYYREDQGTEFPKKVKKATRRPEIEENWPDKEQVALQLRELVDNSQMDLVQFTNLANLSVERGKALIDRIHAVKQIVLKDGISIQLGEQNTKLLKQLIGKEIVDADAAECLNMIANAPEMRRSRNEAASDDDIPDLDKGRRAIRDAFDDKVLDENFPDFGFDLILFILWIVPKYMTVMLFTKLCSITTKIFSIGPKIIGINLGARFLVGLFAKVWNKSANCLIEMIYWTIGVLIQKKKFDKGQKTPLRDMVTGKGSCSRAMRNIYDINVCGKNPESMEINITPFEMEQELLSGYFGLFPDQDPAKADQRCSPSYKPSSTERAMARNIIDAAIQEEMGTKSDEVSKEPEYPQEFKDISFKKTSFSQFSLLDRMESDAVASVTTMEGTTKQLYTKDGDRIVDKVDAGVLGLLAGINGTLQRVDKTVSKVLALEFLKPQAKTWICCIVRLIYIMLPRISHATGNDKIMVKLSPEDFNQYDLDNQAFIEDAKIWIKIIDTFLQIISGSTSLNLDITGMMSVGDMFKNIFKMAIAEAMSILTTSLYIKLKETMFDGLKKMRELPDLSFAMESCPPFDWFMKMFECSIEGFFGKIQEILARLWAESGAQMKDFDMAISISATNGSIQIFRELFNILLDWNDALINFCSLKDVATEAEKEQLLEQLLAKFDSQASPTDIDDTEYMSNLEDAAPVYSDDIHVGPNSANFKDDEINQHSDNGNPFFDAALASIKTAYDPLKPNKAGVRPEDFESKIIHSMPNRTGNAWDPQQAIQSCGTAFASMLKSSEKQISEIHASLSDHWKVKPKPGAVNTDGTEEDLLTPDFVKQTNNEDEKIRELQDEVNKTD